MFGSQSPQGGCLPRQDSRNCSILMRKQHSSNIPAKRETRKIKKSEKQPVPLWRKGSGQHAHSCFPSSPSMQDSLQRLPRDPGTGPDRGGLSWPVPLALCALKSAFQRSRPLLNKPQTETFSPNHHLLILFHLRSLFGWKLSLTSLSLSQYHLGPQSVVSSPTPPSGHP